MNPPRLILFAMFRSVSGEPMAERGMNTADKGLVKTVTKRVGASLRHHREKRLIRSIGGLGGLLVWEVCGLGVR